MMISRFFSHSIVAALLLCLTANIYAVSFFTVTTDRTAVQLTSSIPTNVTTTIRASAMAVNLYFSSRLVGNSGITAMTIAGGTCVEGGTLAANTSCTVITRLSAHDQYSSAVFTPYVCTANRNICSGTRHAVNITSLKIPHSVSITGIATVGLPSQSVTDESYPVTITYTNNDATQPAHDAYIVASYPTGFTESTNTCGTLAAPLAQFSAGDTCTVTGTFVPSAIGEHTITTTLETSNSADASLSDSTTTVMANYIYVPDSSGASVRKCLHNETTGAISDCEDSGATGLSHPIAAQLNPQGTLAYITNSSNDEVLKCTVNDSGSLTGCVDSGAAGLAGPYEIAFNSSDTTAYITNALAYLSTNDNVMKCNVGVSGGLSGCLSANVSFSASATGLKLNAADTQAYISSANNNSVLHCTINGTGDLTNCNSELIMTCPAQITLNPAGSVAYIGQGCTGNTKVYSCDVNAMTGVLSGCAATAPDFSRPVGVAINSANTRAYVSDNAAGIVYQCDIAAGGALSNCSNSGGSFVTPSYLHL
jgi:hypothetical protein